MACMLKDGLRVEMQPYDIASLGDVATAPLQQFLANRRAEISFGMQIFWRDRCEHPG